MPKFLVTAEITVEAADDDAAESLVMEALKGDEIADYLLTTEEEEYDLPDSQVVALFEEEVLPIVVAQYGADDVIAIREEFNNFTDALCKDGQITDYQYNNIDNPY